MSAVKQLRDATSQRAAPIGRKVDHLNLIQGSFSSRRISRQFPLIAGFHRAADGALVGALIVVALMSALTLHWQHLWTVAFTRLDGTRDLAHRLTESTAMLERHLLQRTSLPMSMVPTKAANLIYLDSPTSRSNLNTSDPTRPAVHRGYDFYLVHHGY